MGFIPNAGPVLAIVGFILILIAVKYIADLVGDQSIFNNMIISVALAIIGIIVLGLFVFAAVLSIIGVGSSLGTATATPAFFSAAFFAALATLLAGLVIAWILYIASGIFLRKSYDVVAAKLNVSMFTTAGLFFLIGAALLIVGVGIILVLVAIILQIVAFFSIPERLPSTPQPMPGQPMAPPPAPPGTKM